MEKPTTNVQFAVSALAATLFSVTCPIVMDLAGQVPAQLHGIAVTMHWTEITVGLFALPLVWWRRKAGYICAILIGAFNILGNVPAVAQGMPFSPGMPRGVIAVIVSQTIVSALVVIFCIRAWREPR